MYPVLAANRDVMAMAFVISQMEFVPVMKAIKD